MKEHDELPTEHNDVFVALLHKIIKFAIRALALFMVLVILWGVIDVGYVFYNHLVSPPFMLLQIDDIFNTFAAFLVVLIAIEIFQNIVMYLRNDVIPVQLVLATALMAIARKVIIIDFNELTPMYIIAIGFVVLSAGIAYYLASKILEKSNKNI